MMVLEISTETNLMEHGDGKINPKSIFYTGVNCWFWSNTASTMAEQDYKEFSVFREMKDLVSHRIHQWDVGAEFWQEKFSQSNLQLVPQKLKGRYNAEVINVWLIRKVHQHEIVNAAQEKPVDSIKFIFPLKFENISNQTV